jgi:hypothetical protein
MTATTIARVRRDFADLGPRPSCMSCIDRATVRLCVYYTKIETHLAIACRVGQVVPLNFFALPGKIALVSPAILAPARHTSLRSRVNKMAFVNERGNQ